LILFTLSVAVYARLIAFNTVGTTLSATTLYALEATAVASMRYT